MTKNLHVFRFANVIDSPFVFFGPVVFIHIFTTFRIQVEERKRKRGKWKKSVRKNMEMDTFDTKIGTFQH